MGSLKNVYLAASNDLSTQKAKINSLKFHTLNFQHLTKFVCSNTAHLPGKNYFFFLIIQYYL